MTPREICLELLKPDGKPERQLKQYEALHMVLYDPINTYLRGNRVRGSVSKDRWGTTILFPEDAPGAIPHNTAEDKVCPDITRWRETVHAPDLEANCRDGWEECAKKGAVAKWKILRSSFSTAKHTKIAAESHSPRKLPRLYPEHAINSLPLNSQLFDFLETKLNLL